jgi:hypothetical protein
MRSKRAMKEVSARKIYSWVSSSLMIAIDGLQKRIISQKMKVVSPTRKFRRVKIFLAAYTCGS